jgi:rubrerythrin
MKNYLFIGIIIFSISSSFLTSCGKSDKNETSKTEQSALKETSEIIPVLTEIDSTAEKAKTIDNLQAAYKGEVTAKAKYLAYAQKAEQEGFAQISSLYRAVSAAEHIHAVNHQSVLAESKVVVPIIKPEFTVKTTKENLLADIKGEAYEATSMYLSFIKSAENAGDQIGVVSLTYAMKTEKKHNLMYTIALNALENNSVKTLPSVFFVCSLCGNTYPNKAPARCTFCMTKSEKFMKISKVKANRDLAMDDCPM